MKLENKFNIKSFLSKDGLNKNGGRRYDACLMNPPYDKGLCDKFFAKVMEISNKVVTIQPMGWVFSKKQNKHVTDKLKDAYLEIEIVNGNKYFDAGFLNKVSINYVDFKKDKEIKLYDEIHDKFYEYNDITEVTELSLDKYLAKLRELTKDLCERENMASHYTCIWKLTEDERNELIKLNKPAIRFVGIRGHMTSNNDQLNKDFYTIISNDEKEIKNKVLIRTSALKNKDAKIPYLWICDNEKQQHGLLNYLKTDFCRGCLALIKNNQHLDGGELKYVPWFDFNDDNFQNKPKEIDDWLFKKYNISEDIRKHLEEYILSDYYGIRK